MKKAGVQLLEPVMKVEVVTPDEHMGDVIGDLNSRRGMVQASGMVCAGAEGGACWGVLGWGGGGMVQASEGMGVAGAGGAAWCRGAGGRSSLTRPTA